MEDSTLSSRASKGARDSIGGVDPVLKSPPSNFQPPIDVKSGSPTESSIAARATNLWHSIRAGQQPLAVWSSVVTVLLLVAFFLMLLSSGHGSSGAPGTAETVALAAKIDVAHNAVVQLAKKLDQQHTHDKAKHSKEYRASKRLRKKKDMQEAIDSVLGARLEESIAKHVNRVLKHRDGGGQALKCWTPSGGYNPMCCDGHHTQCDHCVCGRVECCRDGEVPGGDGSLLAASAVDNTFSEHFEARRKTKLADASAKAMAWAKGKIKTHALTLSSSLEDMPLHEVDGISDVLDDHIEQLTGSLHETKKELVVLLADKVCHACPPVCLSARAGTRWHALAAHPTAPTTTTHTHTHTHTHTWRR